jgi:hypothetical protein
MDISKEELDIEILKKIEHIESFKERFRIANKSEIDDICDFVKNDIEKLHDLCIFYHCPSSANKIKQENNFSIFSYLTFYGSKEDCSCKYHTRTKKILDKLTKVINKITIESTDHYLILYYYLNILKLNLFLSLEP